MLSLSSSSSSFLSFLLPLQSSSRRSTITTVTTVTTITRPIKRTTTRLGNNRQQQEGRRPVVVFLFGHNNTRQQQQQQRGGGVVTTTALINTNRTTTHKNNNNNNSNSSSSSISNKRTFIVRNFTHDANTRNNNNNKTYNCCYFSSIYPSVVVLLVSAAAAAAAATGSNRSTRLEPKQSQSQQSHHHHHHHQEEEDHDDPRRRRRPAAAAAALRGVLLNKNEEEEEEEERVEEEEGRTEEVPSLFPGGDLVDTFVKELREETTRAVQVNEEFWRSIISPPPPSRPAPAQLDNNNNNNTTDNNNNNNINQNTTNPLLELLLAVASTAGTTTRTNDDDESIRTSDNNNNNKNKNNKNKNQDYEAMANLMADIMKLVMTGGDNKKEEDKVKEQKTMAEILRTVRERSMSTTTTSSTGKSSGRSGGTDQVQTSNNMEEIFRLFDTYKEQIKLVAEKYTANIDMSKLTPISVGYYLEYQDEIKNYSYKRRIHRFCPSIDYDEVIQLNKYLDLALITYYDTIDEIRTGLQTHTSIPCELVHCTIKSQPGQPASYIAIPINQNLDQEEENTKKKNGGVGGVGGGWKIPNKTKKKEDIPLEIIIGVRGTKSVADAITDLLCDSEPFMNKDDDSDEQQDKDKDKKIQKKNIKKMKNDDKDNDVIHKAHSYILRGGRYIANEHVQHIKMLCETSNKRHVRLIFVGHSLGAGCASIAAMIMKDTDYSHDHDFIIDDVQVYGYGCPALLSKEIAEDVQPYITTIINDNDVVPRMSGISIMNLLKQIEIFNPTKYAKQDVQHLINELHHQQPNIFNKQLANKANEFMHKLIDDNHNNNQNQNNITTNTDVKVENNMKKKKKKDQDDHDHDETKTTPPPPSPSPQQQQHEVELYPPGKCIHFYRDGIGFSGCIVPNTFFHEIDINRRMIDDHVNPSGYQQTFLEVMRQHKNDPNYRFIDD